jgi:hypothetical protein
MTLFSLKFNLVLLSLWKELAKKRKLISFSIAASKVWMVEWEQARTTEVLSQGFHEQTQSEPELTQWFLME